MGQFKRKIISFEVTVTENSKMQMCGFYYFLWIYDTCLHYSKSDIIAENNSIH